MLGPVALVIAAKIVLDLGFHLWGVFLYARWLGGTTRLHLGSAILASLAEPFSFQILRHAGASWGWVKFLTGEHSWGKQTRVVVPEPMG